MYSNNKFWWLRAPFAVTLQHKWQIQREVVLNHSCTNSITSCHLLIFETAPEHWEFLILLSETHSRVPRFQVKPQVLNKYILKGSTCAKELCHKIQNLRKSWMSKVASNLATKKSIIWNISIWGTHFLQKANHYAIYFFFYMTPGACTIAFLEKSRCLQKVQLCLNLFFSNYVLM